jgi:hypothetical protein
MHSSRELRSSSFEITVEGREVRLVDLFEGFGDRDRLGLVLRRPCGAVGASALITAAITAFYDLHRARGPDFFVYPDYFLFHVGRPLGDHARLDIWPSRKEVVVPEDPEQVLEAINDRAITRLVVEDGEPGEPAFEPEALASARSRIATCLAYSATGRVRDADVRIRSNPVSEGYVDAVLDPEARLARLRERNGGDRARADAIAARLGEVTAEERRLLKRARKELREGDVPVETYRRIALEQALGLLAPKPAEAMARAQRTVDPTVGKKEARPWHR